MDNIRKDVSEIKDVCQAESIMKDNRILQQEEEILEAKVKISEWQNEIFRKVYLDVKSALGEAKSFAEFQALLSKNGISVSIKRSSKTNNAQGVIFTRGDYSVKGSKLDRSLWLGRIAKHSQEIGQTEQREVQRLMWLYRSRNLDLNPKFEISQPVCLKAISARARSRIWKILLKGRKEQEDVKIKIMAKQEKSPHNRQ